MPIWIYYSSKTGNTARLLTDAGLPSIRIPRSADEFMPTLNQPFILVTPSYGDSAGNGAIPKAVSRLLNNPQQAKWLWAVVGCGDPSYGARFAQAGTLIAQQYQVPLLHQVAHFGTADDHQRLRDLHASFYTPCHDENV